VTSDGRHTTWAPSVTKSSSSSGITYLLGLGFAGRHRPGHPHVDSPWPIRCNQARHNRTIREIVPTRPACQRSCVTGRRTTRQNPRLNRTYPRLSAHLWTSRQSHTAEPPMKAMGSGNPISRARHCEIVDRCTHSRLASSAVPVRSAIRTVLAMPPANHREQSNNHG